ncbi:MAG: tetratricopeptide repeat protein, partial [Leptolyngbyaceae bacterium]|nr:tetratricopeptide repeat protein [Leptolyngbyaceae bacterium]
MNNRRWLNLAEYVSLFGSGVGSVLSIVSQQVAFASAPISFCLLMSVLNRRQLEQQTEKHILPSLDILHEHLSKESLAIQALRRKMSALPTPDDLGRVNEELGDVKDDLQQKNEEIVTNLAKLAAEITKAQADVQNQVRAELNLNSQQYEDTFARLSVEMTTIQAQVNDLLLVGSAELKPMREDLEQLQTYYGHVRESILGLTQSLETWSPPEKVEQLETALGDLTAGLTELSVEHTQLQSYVQNLPSELTLTPQWIDDQLQNFSSQPLELGDLFAHPQIQQQLEQQISDLGQQVEGLIQSMEGLALKQDVTVLHSEVRSDIEHLQAQQQELGQLIAPISATISDLKQQVDVLSQNRDRPIEPQLEKFKQALIKLSNRVVVLQKRFTELPIPPTLSDVRTEVEEAVLAHTEKFEQELLWMQQFTQALDQGQQDLKQQISQFPATVTAATKVGDAIVSDTVVPETVVVEDLPVASFPGENFLTEVPTSSNGHHPISESQLSLEESKLTNGHHPISEPQLSLEESKLTNGYHPISEPQLTSEKPKLAFEGSKLSLEESLEESLEKSTSPLGLLFEESKLSLEEPTSPLGLIFEESQLSLEEPTSPLELASEESKLTLEEPKLILGLPSEEPKLTLDRPHSRALLEEALNNTQKRLIIASSWLEEYGINDDLIKKLQLLLNQGVQVDIGWNPPSTAQEQPVSKRIQQNWDAENLENNSSSDTSKSLERLIQACPDKFQFKALPTTERLLVCDLTFALIGREVVPASDSVTEAAFMPIQANFNGNGHHRRVASLEMPEAEANVLEVALYTTDISAIQSLIEHFDSSEPDAKDITGFCNRAEARSDLGDHLGAINDYTHVIRLDPSHEIAYNNRGVAYYSLGDIQRAIEDFDQALRLNPSNESGYHNRSLVRFKLGDRQGALEDYSTMLQINPNNDQAYHCRGIIRSKLGVKQGAIADYSTAI